MGKRRKSFAGYTAGEARKAASAWLGNFDEHGPLDIKSIRVAERQDQFVATVTFSEMVVEQTPRHFPGAQPVLLKSA